MSEYYNCNFKINDIIMGVNPDNKFTYLKLFRIKHFVTKEEYGRVMVTNAVIEYTTRNDEREISKLYGLYYPIVWRHKIMKRLS